MGRILSFVIAALREVGRRPGGGRLPAEPALLTDGPLSETLIWGGVRVAQRRCALYGLLIYRQGDRAGVFFSYDFYRNKVVLLPEVKDPRYRDIRELKVPVVVYVEVVYLTDEVASGVEDVLLAEFVVRGTRVLVVS